MSIIIVFAMGLAAGVISGLLGVGGGAVLVPMLVFFLGLTQHMAQGISLVYIIPTAVAGLIQLHKKQLVDYRMAMYLAGGSVAGALISANLVQYISGSDLKRIFGLFVIFTGTKMIMAKEKKK